MRCVRVRSHLFQMFVAISQQLLERTHGYQAKFLSIGIQLFLHRIVFNYLQEYFFHNPTEQEPSMRSEKCMLLSPITVIVHIFRKTV